jgi:hypothetical protein
MPESGDSSIDHLWREYTKVFRDWDDLTLARWMAQTLGQLEGRAWRLNHPLMSCYRLTSEIAHSRGLKLSRLATVPVAYGVAECCGQPLLPLLSRDVVESGLVCQHCGGTAVRFEDLPENLKPALRDWAERYAPVHEVAHWEDKQRKSSRNYDKAFEDAALKAEKLLLESANDLAPRLLRQYPVVVWEDQDECLDVRPEDVVLCP